VKACKHVLHNKNNERHFGDNFFVRQYTFGCLYKQTFRKISLNDSVLPENVFNEEEQALNILIPEKLKGRRYLSEIIETFKQWQDLNKVATVNESDVGVFS
jgi:hypothetical protein